MTTNQKEKYSIWLAITETDYITMFIKVWFTFLATLKEMLPNYNESNIGDGKIINSYREKIFNEIQIDINKEFIKNVLKAYYLGKNEALKSDDLIKEYFSIYYTINDSYSQEFNFKYRGKETSLLLHTYRYSEKEKDYKLEVKLKDERKEFKNYFGDEIKAEINLLIKKKSETKNEVILTSKNRIFEERGEFINTIIKSILNEAESLVSSRSKLDERGKRKRLDFLEHECIEDMKRKLTNELDLKQIFNLNPDNKIGTLDSETLEIEDKPKSFDEDITKWFIDFSYQLRNILFHFIIDPLDKNWQELFRYSYLALKHLAEQNINYLNSLNLRRDSNDNCNT
jgi:hypothetical protein